jgi:hypothetical protein
VNRLGTVVVRNSLTLQTQNTVGRLRRGRPWSQQIHGQIRRVTGSPGLRPDGQGAIAEQKLLLVSLLDS